MLWYDFAQLSLLMAIWNIILLKFRTHIKRGKWWVLFFATYTLIELVSIPLSVKGVNNLWLYNTGRPIEFVFLILYFSQLLRFTKKITYLFLVGGMISCLLLYFVQSMNEYHSLGEVVIGAVITLFSVIYFFRIIRDPDPVDLRATEFWFCTSLFVFFGTSLCINGSLDYFIETNFNIANQLFYGLIINSYLLYTLTIFALLSYRPLTSNH